MTAGRVVSPDFSPERENTLTKGRAAMVIGCCHYCFYLQRFGRKKSSGAAFFVKLLCETPHFSKSGEVNFESTRSTLL